ncbi:hypothetical protein EUGRSUZ_F01520 [Eucalyptus grandis]|uniref:Uncharacterized protein n=2 Tax=Eucalyptus grandis TaxID=71139 RepID=A0ACC3KEF3_EUCGR|nr:hypothetical protein EUGRSUZ_F01520 [Eucalyptus grandis]
MSRVLQAPYILQEGAILCEVIKTLNFSWLIQHTPKPTCPLHHLIQSASTKDGKNNQTIHSTHPHQQITSIFADIVLQVQKLKPASAENDHNRIRVSKRMRRESM